MDIDSNEIEKLEKVLKAVSDYAAPIAFHQAINETAAETRAEAFDQLQEMYGHSDIEDIYTAYAICKSDFLVRLNIIVCDNTNKGYKYDPNELPWSEENKI